MKTKMLILLVVFTLGAFTVFAVNQTEKVEVKGNNDLCKARIEKAALSVEGVTTADWDKETSKLEVVFDDAKTDIDKIETSIAKVGHDTPNHKATDEVYNNLPETCKYREKEKE
jgi:copper chaperone CopZ